jgi:hypothetical protein
MKTRVVSLTLFVASLFIASCAADKHTISFDIKVLRNDTVYLKYAPVSPPITDAVTIQRR